MSVPIGLREDAVPSMREELHILLVEDSLHDVELILRSLKGVDARVDVVQDGVEAMDYLLARGQYENRANQTHPGLVLLDLKLPKMDGLDVLQAIRSHAEMHHLPVVVLTASPAEEDMLSSYRNGANNVIRKPFSQEEFIRVIELMGLYWTFVPVSPPQDNKAAE